MALEDEGEDVGTRYYGTDIDDPMNYSFGGSGYGFEDLNDYTFGGSGYGFEEPDWSGYANLTSEELSKLSGTSSVELNAIANAAKASLGDKAGAFLKKYLFDPKSGSVNLAGLGTAAAALKMLTGGKGDSGGYNKPVPKMEVVREQVQYNDPNRVPGSTGLQYFTDPRFVAQGNAEALAAAKAASATQASNLKSAVLPAPTPAPNPYAGQIPTGWNPKSVTTSEPASNAGLPTIPTELTEQGGLKMAEGGLANAGRYLQGETDGMADKIPSSIDGEQPAALSHGEFVIPADVVSHLGNGNSDAGAQKLYEMMDRIRQARTGTTRQGKEINPDEFTVGGLAAAYAGGGSVKGFDGTTGSSVNATGGSGSGGSSTGAGVPLDTSRTSTLSPWVGDYVTDALGKGAALADAPYQAYKGPLTAGASNLQQQAFAGASDIAKAGYTPGQFTGSFTPQIAQQYMNPYLQASLDPQLKEMQRQSDIARLADTSRLTKAGAYGGSRQAIMESEGRRNLLDKQAGVLGAGYKTAYDLAQQQYAKDRGDEEASRQFGANYGMKTVDQLADLGATQRGITSEGVLADKKAFEEQRDFAYGMPKYQLGLLAGLPIGANTTSSDQTGLAKIQSDISGLGALYKSLEKLIPTSSTTTTTG